ncbi:MAG: hypothetical protein BAJATHORv1_30346 [Candidatus Thorarchaeota archaeon]|nr:MAG: hypothetical protein BAJATHORv1_30346 [Candidatus Thorarchaeota archaeon]
MNPHSEHDCDHIRMPQSVPRGLLRFAILRMMMDDEMSGADVMQTLSAHSDGKWTPSPGSIYPLLSSMEEDGLIHEVRTEGRSRIYKTSELGADKLRTMLEQKVDVDHRVRIGRVIWNILIDVNDRIDLHLQAMHFGLDILLEEISELDEPKLKFLRKQLDLLSDKIEKIKERMEEY